VNTEHRTSSVYIIAHEERIVKLSSSIQHSNPSKNLTQ
jgi:hypothetical protein